ncbi:HNH endonuclease signature motif containing protein [Brevibacillus porteri]|uniref:HNH endonuclease signature motif containing protein n=1 Tax=Brevibacillus porteri TaxID=2126350 RepID=UPI0036365895
MLEKVKRQCTNPKCLKWYPATDEFFYKQKKYSKKNGTSHVLTSWCKACQRENSLKNRTKNAVAYKERSLIHYYENKEIYNSRRRQWRWDHLDDQKEYCKIWQKINPERLRYHRFKRMHKSHDISDSEWKACLNYFNYQCAYCGISLEEHYEKHQQQLHKEHVDHEGANDLSNCVPACKNCNSSKHTYSLEEWYNPDNRNYSQDR